MWKRKKAKVLEGKNNNFGVQKMFKNVKLQNADKFETVKQFYQF
jgi:hypothetical protein